MSGSVQSTNAYGVIGSAIQTGPFKYRVVGYIVFYIVLYIIVFWMISLNPKLSPSKLNTLEHLTVVTFLFAFPALPFILWERSIRKFRRANGLSVYGSIKEELEQREIDERVRKEHRAFVNNGIVKESGAAVDKSDIGYWFGLFERGAISKDEFEAKKRELM